MKETWSLLGFVIVVAPILFLLIGMYVLDYLHDRREKKSLKELSNQQQRHLSLLSPLFPLQPLSYEF